MRTEHETVQPKIDMERESELHERIKDYAKETGVRHPRAYRELIEKGLDSWEDGG